jgi:hypothetical protein
VDDMLVKSKRADNHVADIAEAFDTLRWYENETQSFQMCFRGVLKKISWIYCFPKKDRSQPLQKCRLRATSTIDRE